MLTNFKGWLKVEKQSAKRLRTASWLIVWVAVTCVSGYMMYEIAPSCKNFILKAFVFIIGALPSIAFYILILMPGDDY